MPFWDIKLTFFAARRIKSSEQHFYTKTGYIIPKWYNIFKGLLFFWLNQKSFNYFIVQSGE